MNALGPQTGQQTPVVKKLNLQSLSFFLTYPQCAETKEDLITFLKTKGATECYVVARELHESGDPHLHAYVKYKTKIRTKDAAAFFKFKTYKGNYQTARNPLAIAKYCKKDGDFIEDGIVINAKKKAREDKRSYVGHKLVIENAKLTDLVKEHPEFIFGYERLKNDIQAYRMDIEPMTDYYPRTCYWITGDPGIGKSRYVREQHPGCYNKPQNKWWNGYNGEDVVLLDDLDSKEMGHLLKIWGDNYSYISEVKNGQVKPRYTKMYITSNYRPHELWKDDAQMCAAIERRFKLCTINPDMTLKDLTNLI